VKCPVDIFNEEPACVPALEICFVPSGFPFQVLADYGCGLSTLIPNADKIFSEIFSKESLYFNFKVYGKFFDLIAIVDTEIF